MADESQGPGWWMASDGRWYPPEAAPGATQAPTAGPPRQPPQPDNGERPRHASIRNGALLLGGMVVFSAATGLLFAPAFEPNEEAAHCDGEVEMIESAMKSARSKAGGYVDVQGLLFTGDLQRVDEIQDHDIVLSGPSGQAEKYAIVRTGPCRDEAIRAGAKKCVAQQQTISAAEAIAAASPEDDSWLDHLDDGQVLTIGPGERCRT